MVRLLAPRYLGQVNWRALGGQAALHAAAASGSAETITALLQNGADVELATDRGHTALMIACSLGHLDAAQELLRFGASPAATDHDNKTSQHFAVASLPLTNLVLAASRGGLVSARDVNGLTPLTVAALLGAEPALRALLAAADPSVVDSQANDGMTALMHACVRGFDESAAALLAAGANARLRDAYGQTALHLTVKARPSIYLTCFLVTRHTFSIRPKAGNRPSWLRSWCMTFSCIK